ncbi:uncharacterized protein C9orf85 homolog [Drosophila yakuba]|uniref:CG8675-PA n=1 Tax=Drosophila yakuba TaxID=7245 RepID=B4Q283_DROYA|nr:uncharacterized protein C9orf85 homolog [Drosophila yakuba]EDX02591.1 uncharacterized protein Dyak_GE15606 [Drosophila yakuba]
MSSQRGNVSRTRAQKHKNRHVFKNDLHDKTPQQLRLNAMHVSTVCQRCKEQIEWKIKYKKYKPLTQAKICAHCKERSVKKAYHVVCRDCAIKANACAKCLKSATEVAIEEPQPTPREEQQLQSEMDRLVKSFSERKRRAFLRYMRKGKKQEKDGNEDEQLDEQQLESQEKAKRVAHTRDELLDKIKQLNLAGDGDEDEDDSDFDSDEDDNDSEFDSEEEEDDNSEEEPQKPATKAK